MTAIRAAADADEASWLSNAEVSWWDLVRYGPPGFAVYARIAFPVESLEDYPAEDRTRTALAALAAHTATPATAYAAIWEGWTGGEVPSAPRVLIPHRTMLLFTGPVESLRDAPSLAWYGSSQNVWQEPHLVWPEDRAWCLACEVDEEIEFTVGCSEAAFAALVERLPGAVRRASYGEDAPMYRDQD